MRDYVALDNLWRASLLGALCTVMAVPRIILADMDVWVFVPAAFLCMTLCAGAATAWEGRGGMVGLFPDGKIMGIGLAIAVVLAGGVSLAYWLWLDDVVIRAIESGHDPKLMELRYPSTVAGCLALILWTAGFETLFLKASALSFVSRLTGRYWLSVLFAALLQAGLAAKMCSVAGITEFVSVIVLCAIVGSVVGSMLFCKFGLLPAMVFAGGSDLYLLWRGY